jgi:NRPS condensation-like uncharacterized protein
MRHHAEIFDHLQYLYDTTGFNDHQLHCVIRFEEKVNTQTMELAVRALVKSIPMLSRAYRNLGGKAYWEDMEEEKRKELFCTMDKEEDFDQFTCSKTDLTGPQIKVCLLKAKQDALSVVMNHMVTDGAGIKQCMYLLSGLYSKIAENPDDTADAVIDGDRGFYRIIAGISRWDRLKILLRHNKDNNQASMDAFPMSKKEGEASLTGAEHVSRNGGRDGNTYPFILIRELSQDCFKKIHAYSKGQGATVNDVVLAAYFRVLTRLLACEGKVLNLPIMIDMRRYLEDKSLHALTNLSSTVIVSIAVDKGEAFDLTLKKVSEAMKAKKDNYLGLSTFLKLDTLYKVCGRRLAYGLLQKHLNNPLICMTNIGRIEEELLNFEGSAVKSAFICGSIKYRPHFQLAISSFHDKMTLCVNLYGSREDQDRFKDFLTLMEQELSV